MQRTYSIGKRLIALVLSLVLILSVMPSVGVLGKASAASVDTGILETLADVGTLDSWKDAFNPKDLSTEHAGGVWTDKSVIKAEDVSSVFGNIAGLEAGTNNFLVALSALAANSVVLGQGTTPTDTILVLDISGSMSSANLRAMVTAANDSIHTLLAGNEKNRVGVVLYSTSASVLLPLGRYTPVTETQGTASKDDDVIKYIEYSNSRIRAARVASGGFGQGSNNQANYTYITDSNGEAVTTSISTGGGTYIQGGLWKAWEQFDAATVTDERAPVLVLMSDGAPTFITNDFNCVPNGYEGGDGNSSGDGEGFLTQLTAAYVKAKIAAKYSTGTYNAKAYLYTLGLGLSTGNTTSVAQAVLDTGKTRSGMTNYWDTYLGLAAKQTKTMDVEVYRSGWGSSTTDVTVTYDAILNNAAQKNYVDKYFSASSAGDLSAAFKGIVNEISLKSSYYVTRLDGQNANAGGYVTFVDEIGTGMEVKEIEGILIGDTLYTGLKLAQALKNGSFGTQEEATELGDNMVWALVQRLGITDVTDDHGTVTMTAGDIARDLLNKAFAAGQLKYESDTNWSNLICWFGDANGNYIGFWDKDDPNAQIPEGAAFANMCYGMLGATTESAASHASDMMYVAVQVSKPVTKVGGRLTIQEKSPQTVTFRIPASLLPTVTYQISVEEENREQIDTQTAAAITYNAADPIRLIYEVGVHSALTPENIHQFVREGYQAKASDGNYYLYTNAWNWTPADGSAADFNNPPTATSEELKDTGKNAITYAYFEPGEDNEHYYFTDDTLIYTKNAAGDYVLYEGDEKPSGTCYYKHLVYTATADSQDPAKEAAAAVTVHYEMLSDAALKEAVATDGAKTWQIPKGTMHRNSHSHNRDKTANTTGSFFAIRHQLVDMAVNGDHSHHYELIYMGNNGRVTYAPAQGVALTKEMAAGETAEGKSFSFTVTVAGDTDGKVTVTRNGISAAETLVDNQLQLTLAAGETVLITGMDIGATYTIQENKQDGFKLSGIAADAGAVVNNAAGTVSNQVVSNQIHTVTYTNAIQHYGSLLISKEVDYLKNSQPVGANAAKFTVKVTFPGLGGEKVYLDGAAVELESDGTYTFPIVDGKSVLITGIPEGTAYGVEELLKEGTHIPAGYEAEDGYTAVAYSFNGTIVKDTAQMAALKNQYVPGDVIFNDVEPKITVRINKTLAGTQLNNWAFDFELLYFDGSAWTPVMTGLTATRDDPSMTFNLEDIQLSSVGEHYFRVAEVIPAAQMMGMTYDRTFHDFKVTVMDDLSGKLKIQRVESVQHAVVGEPVDSNNDGVKELWTVTTGFTNTFAADSTKLTIQANKTLFNKTTGVEVPMALRDGQFRFTLYKADQNFGNLEQIDESANGVTGQIIFTPITYEFNENGTEKTYYYVVKETSQSGSGYTVDSAVYKITVTVKQQQSAASGSALQITNVTVQKNEDAVVDVTQSVLDGGNVLNGSTVSFKNIYQATPAQVQINGTKNLFDLTPGAGNAAIAVPNGLFSFKLTALNGAPMEAGNGDGYKIVTNDGSTFTFPAISYTQAGTYHYTVSEEAVTAAGYSKDTAVHNITVFVTDDGAGRLTAVAAYNGEEVNSSTVQAVFNNTYKAEPVTDIVLKGSKALKVDTTKFTRSLRAGEFRFTLTKPDGTTQTVVNDAAGKFSFAPLTFTELGTYTYTVTEEGAGTVKNGMTYDKASYKVTVTVTDGDKDGKLEAAVKYEKVTDQGGVNAQEAVFVNEYKAAPVSVQLTAHKYLVGNRDLEANEFSFTMTKPGGVTETVKNGKDGIVTFESVTYSAAGTYVYTIVEDKVDQAGNPLTPDQDGNYVYNGVTYSRVEYTVTVKITDNGSGALVAHIATVDNNGNELPVQFFNRYEAQSVTVNLTGENDKLGGKILEDKTSGDDKKDLSDFEFKFVLTDEDGNEIETVSDNDVNGFKFTGIKFTELGEKVYYIYERNTGATGVSYDEARFKVTVQINDNEKGQLEADLRYERITVGADGAENSQVVQEISFTNTYEADSAGMWISGTKELHNETPNVANKIMATPAGMFSFKLTALNGAPMGAGNTTGYEIKSNDADGKFAFTPIHYTQEGTYKYTLAEEDTSVAGVTKDITIHHITVIVKDNGAGQLAADITCDGEQVSGNTVQVQFQNTYLAKPVTGIVLSGNKILDVPDYLHHSLQAGDFSFTLTKPDGKTETVANDGEGKFSFTALDFDAVGTYTYKITEVGGGTSKDGIAYDGKTITVVIVVEDGGNGKLVAKVGDTQITNYNVGTFKNTYRAQSVTVNLEGEKANTEGKTLEDQSSLVDKTLNDFEFKFVLTDANGNVIETVADNGAGFDFADITYSAPAQKVYFIYELDEDVPGMIYDTAKYKVIVKVTDNETGRLEAEVSYEKITTDPNGRQETEKADKITFANTYTAKETAVSFTGLKTFNGGRKLKAGEFSFILKDANGKEMETVSNDGDGKFTFKSITYTEEGEHVYTLEEVKGQDDKVTYDSTKYTLTVTVTDVNGALKATTQITVDNKEAESYGFTNLFTPENAVAKITVEKILVNNTDQEVGLNGFQFDLSCVETGKLISVISGTDGLAELELGFGAADVGKTYTYLLTEHKGNVEGMTYSDAVYQIKVVVTQDAQTGALVLNVTRDGAAAAGNAKFTNTLNKVTPPENEIPKTGDETFVGGWILMMSVSAISLLAVLVMGKRKHAEQ